MALPAFYTGVLPRQGIISDLMIEFHGVLAVYFPAFRIVAKRAVILELIAMRRLREQNDRQDQDQY